MKKQKAIFSWSGGKDSAFALYQIRRGNQYDVCALLTTVTEDFNRISMHGVRNALLEAQAESIGIRLEKVFIPKDSSDKEYESRMKDALLRYTAAGVFTVIFGDIFLDDLKKYREEKLSRLSMKAAFPIWKRDTASLAVEFISNGFKAVITCVDSKAMDVKFAGAAFDHNFLKEIPAGVDPCGENGEFHSFVFDGPIFNRPIGFIKGETVLKQERFCYCDIIPTEDRYGAQ